MSLTNLNALVAPLVAAVNPSQTLTVKVSTGYATNADGSRVPSYASPVTVQGQVQALSWGDLRQLDGLNIQGVKHAIYLNGDIEGLVRSENQGGDLITDTSGNVYLVTTVLENWGVWTKVAATLQDGS